MTTEERMVKVDSAALERMVGKPVLGLDGERAGVVTASRMVGGRPEIRTLIDVAAMPPPRVELSAGYTVQERMVSMGVARTLDEARELLPLSWYGVDVKSDPFEAVREHLLAAPDLAIIRTQLDQAAVDVRHARRLARRGPWVPPRGAARRSRQVRSQRARAARRVAAREGRP